MHIAGQGGHFRHGHLGVARGEAVARVPLAREHPHPLGVEAQESRGELSYVYGYVCICVCVCIYVCGVVRFVIGGVVIECGVVLCGRIGSGCGGSLGSGGYGGYG